MTDPAEKSNMTDLQHITPIQKRSMADQVEAKLIDFFRNSNLSPGDPVPKEVELAATLGVSRNVLREALSRLRMLGVVDSRKKRGMVMGKPDLFSGFSRLLHPDMLELETIEEIFELRLVIELGIADLLFLRKTDSDIEALQGIIARENAASDEERIKSEVAFHKELYRIAGNETLRRFQTMLLPLFRFVAELEAGEAITSRYSVSHQDLVNALKEGTADEYRELMREHLSPHFNRIASWRKSN
jgi:DNA-binding FadR family transcriptional regulator